MKHALNGVTLGRGFLGFGPRFAPPADDPSCALEIKKRWKDTNFRNTFFKFHFTMYCVFPVAVSNINLDHQLDEVQNYLRYRQLKIKILTF